MDRSSSEAIEGEMGEECESKDEEHKNESFSTQLNSSKGFSVKTIYSRAQTWGLNDKVDNIEIKTF